MTSPARGAAPWTARWARRASSLSTCATSAASRCQFSIARAAGPRLHQAFEPAGRTVSSFLGVRRTSCGLCTTGFYLTSAVLQWLEGLVVFASTSFHGVTAAYRRAVGARMSHLAASFRLDRAFKYGYIGWSLHSWICPADSRPAAELLCDCSNLFDAAVGRHGNLLHQHVLRDEPRWPESFYRTWVQNHATWCDASCARVLVVDGGLKLFRDAACAVATGSRDINGTSVPT